MDISITQKFKSVEDALKIKGWKSSTIHDGIELSKSIVTVSVIWLNNDDYEIDIDIGEKTHSISTARDIEDPMSLVDKVKKDVKTVVDRETKIADDKIMAMKKYMDDLIKVL